MKTTLCHGGILATLLLAAASAHLPAAGPEGISAERHGERREAVRRSMGPGIAVLWGEEEESVRGFRQDSDFLYLTGADFPGAALLMVSEGEDASEDRETLFTPNQTERMARWVSPHVDPDSSVEEKRAVGFERVRDIEDLPAALRRAVASFGEGPVDLWLLYAEGTPGEPLSAALQRAEELRRRFPQARVRNLRPILARHRQVKDPEEVAHLRAAIEATAAGLRGAMAAAQPGMTEMELRSVIEAGFLARGAPRVGFSSIVGSGPNSVVLHYPAGHRVMEKGDLVVMDVGAEVTSGYTADITRTIPVSGRFTPRQRELYRLVLRAHQAAVRAVRPGATLREVHRAAREVLEKAGHGDDFWHGTSHWLGLDVHDVGEGGRPLEPGMVLTIEPGLYLPEEGIGIRVEDDVLVTEEGAEILSEEIPRTAREIERAMRR